MHIDPDRLETCLSVLHEVEKHPADQDAARRPRLPRPLDLVDGAARVYDPIVRGEQGEDVYGCFLKDYEKSAW